MKKRSKILAAALAMMTFSTAAAVTGTVAWFTASNVVTASGMSIQAEAEQGIVVANETFTKPSTTASSEWNDYAKAAYDGTTTSGQAKFIPTSTADGSAWYHANASEQDNHAANSDGYTTLSNLTVSNGIASINNSSLSINGKNIYLLNKFYLKSSAPEQITGKTLYVNKVTATGNTASQDLDKSLRVLVVHGSDSKIFAPFDGATLSYNVNGSSTATTAINASAGVVNTELSTNVTIPGSATANTPNLLCEVSIYIYFEGEDENCKSSKITAELDTLSLEVKFGTETLSA